jgi:hypothetical protein
MNFPLYLYYEMLIRVSEFQPEVGDYQFVSVSNEIAAIKTTTSELKIANEILLKQFHDPDLISAAEIKQIARNFQLRTGYSSVA